MTVPPGRVVVVGDLVTDVLAVLSGPVAAGTDTPARIQFTAGGSAANTAAWFAALGVPVTLVAAAGTDPAGGDRIAELTAAGVDCAIRRHEDAVTGTVVVLAGNGDRSMLCDRGANALLRPSDVDNALAAAPDAVHLHLSGYTLFDDRSRPAGLRALAAARQAGRTVSVDAASAGPLTWVGAETFLAWVHGVDLLLANADEARVLAGSGLSTGPEELAARLASACRYAVIKLAEHGAVWAGGGATVRCRAEPVTLADPTGAGDAFAAGLLTAWLAGADPAGALAAGARSGARAVTRVGARP